MYCSIDEISTIENLLSTNAKCVSAVKEYYNKYAINGSLGLDSIILELFSLIFIYAKIAFEKYNDILYSPFQLYVPLHSDGIEGIYPENILDILQRELKDEWNVFIKDYVGLFYCYILPSDNETNNFSKNIIFPLKSSLSNARQGLFKLDQNLFNELTIYFDGNVELTKRKKNKFSYFSVLLESSKYYEEIAAVLQDDPLHYQNQSQIVQKSFNELSDRISLKLFQMYNKQKFLKEFISDNQKEEEEEEEEEENENIHNNNNNNNYNDTNSTNEDSNDNNNFNGNNNNNDYNNNDNYDDNDNDNYDEYNNYNDNYVKNSSSVIKKNDSMTVPQTVLRDCIFTVPMDRDLYFLNKFYLRSMAAIGDEMETKSDL